jgi:LmbE family N-acetylglucosaminyl deacetylase
VTQPAIAEVSRPLPPWDRVLAVVAHPDDESFALGALLDAFATAGTEVSVLCLTRGEASTLGATGGDLASLRETELRAAAAELGAERTTLRSHPDGGLDRVDPTALEADVEAEVATVEPDGVLVFDPAAGVTGHEDHARASRAAVTVAREHGIPTLGWALPATVSNALNEEFGAAFNGYAVEQLTPVAVDRHRQMRAIRRHASQAVPGSVLWRRLELLGEAEYVRPV